MSEFKVELRWERKTPDFSYDGYDRTHEVVFPGGQKIQCSAAVEYKGNPNQPNPEELLAAALSSCHMLTFLAICSRKKMLVDSYIDHAVATLGKNEHGKVGITRALLSPKVVFSGNQPNAEELAAIHKKSHEACFIANSVSFPVEVK